MNAIDAPGFSLLVEDNFAPDAEEIRDAVLSQNDFKTVEFEGAQYTGIAINPDPGLDEIISERVGFKIKTAQKFYRLNFAGENPHSWIHADSTCSKYAGLLYLNTPDQCQGGTALWKHRATDWTKMPSTDQITQAGFQQDKAFADWMHGEWNKKESWDITAFCGMKFNRFIVYPTSAFHSRYPFEGFGTTNNEARLVWVLFFDRE